MKLINENILAKEKNLMSPNFGIFNKKPSRKDDEPEKEFKNPEQETVKFEQKELAQVPEDPETDPLGLDKAYDEPLVVKSKKTEASERKKGFPKDIPNLSKESFDRLAKSLPKTTAKTLGKQLACFYWMTTGISFTFARLRKQARTRLNLRYEDRIKDESPEIVEGKYFTGVLVNTPINNNVWAAILWCQPEFKVILDKMPNTLGTEAIEQYGIILKIITTKIGEYKNPQALESREMDSMLKDTNEKPEYLERFVLQKLNKLKSATTAFCSGRYLGEEEEYLNITNDQLKEKLLEIAKEYQIELDQNDFDRCEKFFSDIMNKKPNSKAKDDNPFMGKKSEE